MVAPFTFSAWMWYNYRRLRGDNMIFRIEDTSNPDGNHRKYNISLRECPTMTLSQLNEYISNEIRKQVNNSKDRRLLSYSKSLMICLMKYNEYTDNELHINTEITRNSCGFIKFLYESKLLCIPFDLRYDLSSIRECLQDTFIVLHNFAIDIADNELLDRFLHENTATHRKKVASPEKDHEVLLFQSPNDIILTEYLQQAYILLALSIRYGLPSGVANYIKYQIEHLPELRFDFCPQERQALIDIVCHIYYNQAFEKQVLKTIKDDEVLRISYDAIYQFKSIIDRESSFDDLYGDDYFYNNNVVSNIIFEAYSKYLNSLPFSSL